MKHFTCSLLIFIFFALPVIGSNFVRLKITDDTSTGLSHCDVFVKNKWHLLSDDAGYVNIPLTYCNIGDTIQISYMGYERLSIVVSSQFLKNRLEQIYQLTPLAYSLEDITILGNTEKLFEKKKRNMLLPYSNRHVVYVTANISHRDENGKQINTSGKLKVLFTMSEQTILENTCTTDSLLLHHITRGLVLSSYIPYDCCFSKYRKLNDIYYLGMQKNKWMFRFDIKPQNVTHPYYALQEGDESSSIVSVDGNGFITRIETRTDIKSGKSRSYNLLVDYTEHKRKMAPIHIVSSYIDEKTHIELECTYE